MINLDEADQSVRDDDRPEHSAVDSVDHKADTADHIHDPDFPDVFQYKAQHDKQRCGISYVSSNFRNHEKFLKDNKLNHFQ